MDVYIKALAVHVIMPELGQAILSKELHDISCNANDFVIKHIKKLFKSLAIKKERLKTGTVREECALLQVNRGYFLDATREIARKMFTIMSKYPDIPSADVVFALATVGDTDYLVVLKLNYKTIYNHKIEAEKASIIETKSLPDNTLHEAFAVNLTTMQMIILEKRYDLEGEKEFYLSSQLLNCEPEKSGKEKLACMEKVTKNIVSKYYSDEGIDDLEKIIEFKNTINEQHVEGGKISTEKIAEKLFGKIPQIKETYLAELEAWKVGQEFEINMEREDYYDKQRMVTDTGFNITMPVAIANDKAMIQQIQKEDGTIDIVIKSVKSIRG